ncbi:nucleotide exchange factor GrpE [Kocuria palustris]|uniref:nucleotide exchange factor GrpE n=1 Tax=Kocuria palustris TaxID=71999 RepID=UPI0021A56866|nr:nucleotide exchange factor GrpE [Kocuria palustris]MCT1591306.1 nucleotide exchange factor GrpE [Kocuria palustris]
MTTNPEDPRSQGQEPGDSEQPAQDQEQTSAEQPLTPEDVLGAEQTEEARQADQDQQPEGDDLARERLEDLRRLQAEFVNYKNRTAREREQLRDHVVADVIGSLIPVLDDIDAGRQAGEITDGPFARISEKLEDMLRRSGLERVGAVGEAFDPNVHEAVLQQPAEGVEADHVSLVLRSGFRVGGRVVRAAQVAVAPGE